MIAPHNKDNVLSERLTALCKKEKLCTHWVQAYINNPSEITEEKFLSLGYKKRAFLNILITYKLIGNNMLKIVNALALRPWQMRCVKEAGHYVLDFILKIKELLSLTKEQLKILGHRTIYYVLESTNISWADLIAKKISLHNGQLTLAKAEPVPIIIFTQTMGHFFSLQRLLNFKKSNINLLRNFHIARYLDEGYLTLEQIETATVIDKEIWAYNPNDFPMQCVLGRVPGYSFSVVFAMQPEQCQHWKKEDDKKENKAVTLQEEFTKTIQAPHSRLREARLLPLATIFEVESLGV